MLSLFFGCWNEEENGRYRSDEGVGEKELVGETE